MAQSNTPRIKGDKLTLSIGGVNVAEGSNAEVYVNPTILESKAWGDNWKVKQSAGGEWEIRCDRMMRSTNIGTFLTYAVGEAENTTNAVYRAVLYVTYGATTTRVFEGDVIIGPATFKLPEGLAEENVTLIGTGEPVYPAGLV